jgi:hypothetical protein
VRYPAGARREMLPDILCQLRIRPSMLLFCPNHLRVKRRELPRAISPQEADDSRASTLAGANFHWLVCSHI